MASGGMCIRRRPPEDKLITRLDKISLYIVYLADDEPAN